MTFDLPTLQAVWIGIDIVIGLAFLAQHRRLRRVGGLGWWALTCLMHAIASLSLAARPLMSAWFGLPLSNLLFTFSISLLWVGFRAHVGLSVRRVLTGVAVLMAVLWLAYDFFIVIVDSLPARQLLWVGSNVAVLGLMLGDVLRHRPRPVPTEFRALAWVVALQILVLLGYVLMSVPMGWPFEQTASLVTFCYLIVFLLSMLTFQCLVMLRVRDEANAARSAQRERESDLQHLVDNIDVGVMEFLPDQSLWRMNTAARRYFTWREGEGVSSQTGYANWHLLDEHGRPLRNHEKPLEHVLTTMQAMRDLVIGFPPEHGARLRWALCNCYPKFDAQGGLHRVVLTLIDITNMRAAQLEQKAVEARFMQQ